MLITRGKTYNCVRPDAGLFFAGHKGSSVTLGSLLGIHIGYPVMAWIEGLAGSRDQSGFFRY
jgi:hypothetical protein